MACALCEEEKSSYRTCRFRKVMKEICSDCLGQWRIEERQESVRSIVLYDRYV